jgi:spore germination protein GerM
MIIGAILFVVSCKNKDNVLKTDINVYYADAEINRLLPYEKEIVDADSQCMAQAAIELLAEGWDGNDKIRRLIPEDKGCISVRVNNDTAYVDISSSVKENLPQNRDIERMFLYQITNTLTEIKGIRFVKFTVDGKIRKDFMGFFDMRETYKHKYPE